MGAPRRALTGALACLALAWAACNDPAPTPAEAPPEAEPAAAQFVGAAVCATCHPDESQRWRGSHHDLAMQGPEAALGPFAGESFRGLGGEATFLRRNGERLVRAPGPSGEPVDHPVAWVFGVEPLQQLLLPLSGGRLQAFDVAWDARPRDAGGQRWYSLHPDEARGPEDPLHWTRHSYNWNASCAECHSTNLRKNYRPDENRYETTFSEPDVSCEACHGPGSRHVEQGGAGGLLTDLRNTGTWRHAGEDAIARRDEPPPAFRAEVEACARCHSRRSSFTDDYTHGRPLLDTHRPALLDENLYFADGQIRDEVFVWGSFLQSAMYTAGVTCADCHDPHALAVADADATCGRCHRPEVFASPEHHHHPLESEGARCVGCHMPARVYMGIDARRDHSLRVPRPALSARLGAPDACTTCHGDRDALWAAEVVAGWGGTRQDEPHWGTVLQAGRRGSVGALPALADLAAAREAPGIVRASALRLLGRQPGPDLARSLSAAARDPEPLLRLAAAEASVALPPRERLAAVRPLLEDERAVVRMEAARSLATVPPTQWRAGDRIALIAPLAEWRAAQRFAADAPSAQANLGTLHAELGEVGEARDAFTRALELDPAYEPVWVNLADLARLEGREDEAERVLRRGLATLPNGSALHHSLGLTLIRQRRHAEALPELERAAVLSPQVPRYTYVLGIALHESGDTPAALAVLEEAARLHPGDRSLLQARIALHRASGDADSSQTLEEQLRTLDAP